MIFSLIPARAGSKGIKNKNLSKINNLSLVSMAIESALGVESIDQITVSSNSNDVKHETSKYNIDFLNRPESISSDQSTAKEVVEHFFQENEILDNDIVIYLQPTCPFRSSKNISEALDLFFLEQKPITSLSSEKKFYEKYLSISENGNLTATFGKDTASNRQSLNYAYQANGAIYIFSKLMFLESDGFPIDNSYPYFMNKIESIDIDDIHDLTIARTLAEHL
jgi:CMP-N-acetylneuraminic acid synthetase